MGVRRELVEPVQARLFHVTKTGSLASVMDQEAFEEGGRLADALNELLTAGYDDLQARHALGYLYWFQSQGMDDEPGRAARAAAVTLFAPCFLTGAGILPEPLLPELLERAVPDAVAMLRQLRSQARKGVAEPLNPARLDEATVLAWTQITTATAGRPAHAAHLPNLCGALQIRAARTGLPEDLDAAVDAGRRSVTAAPPGHPVHANAMSNLSGALRARYEHQRDPQDLDEAVDAARHAVAATPEPGPDRSRFLANLASVSHMRYHRTADLADLNAAVDAARAATAATDPRAATRGHRFATLSGVLLDRYELGGMSADLDEAVDAGLPAAAAMPEDHPDLPALVARVGEAIRRQAERTGDAERLDAAVALARRAIDLTPETDQAAKAARRLNLAVALLHRAESFPDRRADLDEAIAVGRQATADPGWARVRILALTNLSTALRRRFERSANRADLDAAVAAGREAVRVAGHEVTGGFEHAVALTNLGSTLAVRLEKSAEAGDLAEAVRLCTQAAHMATAPALLRTRAAATGGRMIARTDPAQGAALLETAVALLPLLAPRHKNRADTAYALGELTGVANDAAAAILADDQPRPSSPQAARALAILEQGRAVLLGRGLDVRGDQAALEREHPALAARLDELRILLDGERTALLESDPDLPAPVEQDRISLTADLRRLLDHIRSQDGFATFGLPPDPTALATAGAEGPVVVFVVTLTSGHALLLTAEGIRALPLPGLTIHSVLDQGHTFYSALQGTSPGMSEVLEWLWDTVAGPVLDALGIHTPPGADEPAPRIWWVTGGVLGMLPIHAAGYHRETPASARRTVLDRTASSYVPTVRALLQARNQRDRERRSRQQSSTPVPALSSLIVAMPTTPGAEKLPGSAAEAEALRPLLPDPATLIEPEPGTEGVPPTKPRVLQELTTRSIAHFACHGHHDPNDPAAGHLLLHDHRQDPLSVKALAALALGHANLAYLSACDTALGLSPGRLIDESLHLATAFHLAGFQHVIGTQWMANDLVAVNVASAFYRQLLNPTAAPTDLDLNLNLNLDRCAHALREAVLRQRNRHAARPHLWAPYIHVGT
ncbi:conserved hypothetical protein [Catenulispora acidiphila DSM 44928]|uniref:CHAT domain-containing protein n=1 Tax=Catenulispora acidiphila (strain DSM 44928 / JCM 14897 / NBRC 102108 / NRRL B-24433 / ID139908) TaxID=479433 RepID=C7PYD8_CATAD|nr:CHAT domain-containing protein [Catenulispora acidiphila]ACU75428.1 conserved hypothetical protein [Catenulispora acidiphila DSM 44928]